MEIASEEDQGPPGAVEPVMMMGRRRRGEAEDDKRSLFNISSSIT